MARPRFRAALNLNREEWLPAALLLVFFCILCLAGGASREDVLSQSIVRGGAVLLMILQVVFSGLPQLHRYKGCTILLSSMAAVAILQLIPLPPALWTALPGRAVLANSPLGAQSWRPLNIVPDAGLSALFSLLVPLCVLSLLSSLDTVTVRRARHLMFGAVIVSALVALLQATGSAPDNGLMNGSTNEYAGIFANRNHEALFLAIGIALAWFWGLEHGVSWRSRRLWLAIGIIVLLSFSILLTGSRSGMALGAFAIVVGMPLASSKSGRGRRGRASSVAIWVAISVCLLGGVLLLSSYLGRAQSLDRAVKLGVGEDFRFTALPTVWQLAKTYFPFGAGLGSFDAVFRMAEPFAILKPTYFNHAHDDLLETVIETGLAGPVILLSAMGWLVRRAIVAFTSNGQDARMGRLGVVMTVLIVSASVSDYPARTPMIMVVLTMAGAWLERSSDAHPNGRPQMLYRFV
jgi:O-antigen ligase